MGRSKQLFRCSSPICSQWLSSPILRRARLCAGRACGDADQFQSARGRHDGADGAECSDSAEAAADRNQVEMDRATAGAVIRSQLMTPLFRLDYRREGRIRRNSS